MAIPNQKLDKNGKPVTGYAAFVAHEWSEINKTRTEKVTRTKFIAISKSIGRKWRKMSKAAKSGFSNPHQESTTPSDETVSKEKEDIINQLNELINQRQEISDEKEKLTCQIMKIGIEKKKIAYERAQLEYKKEELINQLREFTKIASEDKLPTASSGQLSSADPSSQSTIANIKPKKTAWSTEELVEDLDDTLTAE